jgi:hypothetical protein
VCPIPVGHSITSRSPSPSRSRTVSASLSLKAAAASAQLRNASAQLAARRAPGLDDLRKQRSISGRRLLRPGRAVVRCSVPGALGAHPERARDQRSRSKQAHLLMATCRCDPAGDRGRRRSKDGVVVEGRQGRALSRYAAKGATSSISEAMVSRPAARTLARGRSAFTSRLAGAPSITPSWTPSRASRPTLAPSPPNSAR